MPTWLRGLCHRRGHFRPRRLGDVAQGKSRAAVSAYDVESPRRRSGGQLSLSVGDRIPNPWS